ncbi:hypothetical protein GCK72_021524 [Caenorhabditis remanei]|uniref:Uncharacterized protein n=1 Tax=Caenorhabditis remanei TaxID=31234 RepID=A0A6A5GIE4_CAERE|nr:hypothetical protein GCK72_021524 [Caenorhabditis remanei]KAF1754958.1 hypothetical protein GCK72_021524 [Caenorhabditis remanei]
MSTESSFGYVPCSSCNEKITDQFWMLSENKFCSACHSKSLGSKTTKKKLPTCANKVCRTRLKYGSKLHPKTKEEVCFSCYSFVIMNGKDRETKRERKTLKDKMREYKNKKCANKFCQLPLLHTKRYASHPITKEKICMSCYCYYKRKGKDREVIRVRGDYKERLAQVFTQEKPSQDNFLKMLQYMPTTVEVIKVNHMGGGSDQKLDSDEDFEKRPSDFNADLEDVALVNPEQLDSPIEDKPDVLVSDELRKNILTSDHLAYSQRNELPEAENATGSEKAPSLDEFEEERAVESFMDADGYVTPAHDVSDSDRSSYSSTSSESLESSDDSADNESDDENYSMESTFEDSSTVTQDNGAPSPILMNTTEDSMKVESPVQLELKEPANNTQITHENPTQEPPKENEYKIVCYDPQSEVPIGKEIMSAIDEDAEYNESEEQAPEPITAKSSPSSKRRKSPDKEENIRTSFKEKA